MVPIERRASPNSGARTCGPTDILLIHYTGMPDAEQALAWLCNPASGVSCHFFVFEDGRIVQLVPESRRAWHAGASRWAGESDVNSRSIGIEVANPGHDGGSPPFPERQIEALTALCRTLVGRHPIPPRKVLAHSDVAPGRKLDPGERFPWAHLAAAGIGHWCEPAPIDGGPALGPGATGAAVERLQALLALYGYGIGVTGAYDARTEAVVAAFQRHFRPALVDGVADRSTIETLRRLISALP
ncbi:peptidoglycan recognition protein family protein [Faunimonas sp. B44]|uniref:peptidoglycan recognition protein family protein n=1 Tax=Faunimonas sp. B44 TaxID=3461493 RepID=UPI004044E387